MSLYINGVLQAGVNDIPSYTRAEYKALTEKPEYWICTDMEYNDLPSEYVTYESGTVKDALDELTDDSGWQNLTTAYTAKYRKKGSIVEVVVQILNETEIPSQTAIPVGTLPTGFRPAFPIYGVGTVGSTGSEIGYMYINTNGEVQIVNTSASIQRYLVVNMMFLV